MRARLAGPMTSVMSLPAGRPETEDPKAKRDDSPPRRRSAFRVKLSRLLGIALPPTDEENE